jgi:hypothetical protein
MYASQALDLPDCHSYTAITMVPYKFSLFPVLILAGSIAFLAVGCSGKKVHYPEDHERYLRIDRAVEALRLAYVREDSSDLAALMMPVDQLERLKEEAKGDFETFSTITLDFATERIMIDGQHRCVRALAGALEKGWGRFRAPAARSFEIAVGRNSIDPFARDSGRFSLWCTSSAGHDGPHTFFQEEVINVISSIACSGGGRFPGHWKRCGRPPCSPGIEPCRTCHGTDERAPTPE